MAKGKQENMSIAEYNVLLLDEAERLLTEAIKTAQEAQRNSMSAETMTKTTIKLIAATKERFEQMRLDV